MYSSPNIEDTLMNHLEFGTYSKPGFGQRQQKRGSATSSASTTEHTRHNQKITEDVHCEQDSLGRGEASMETDGEYSAEEVNKLLK